MLFMFLWQANHPKNIYNKICFDFVDIKHSKIEIFHQEELVTTKRYVCIEIATV